MKEEKYQIGVDLAIKPSWWKRLLVWIHLGRKDWDYSCIVVGKVDKKGILHILHSKDI